MMKSDSRAFRHSSEGRALLLCAQSADILYLLAPKRDEHCPSVCPEYSSSHAQNCSEEFFFRDTNNEILWSNLQNTRKFSQSLKNLVDVCRNDAVDTRAGSISI